MSIHGDIRINHRVIGYWQAQCQPGKDGIHPYRWGATLNGVTVRGVLTHIRRDETRGYRHADCDADDSVTPTVAREVCDRCWLEKSITGECGCEP